MKFILHKKDEYFEDYLSKEKTISVKGIFVILVFMSHIMSYMYYQTYLDKPYIIIANILGQLIVVMFFFYSGYGIYENIKNKGESYIKLMPKKRILTTFIHFDIAVLLFIMLGFILGKEYNIKNILLSFIGWEAVGNSNWFMFAILYLYTTTYLSFSTIKDKHKALCVNTIFSLIYLIVMYNLKESWWYNTILCYIAGMWFAKYKNIIEKSMMEKYYTNLIFCIVLFFTLFCFRNEIIAYELYAIMFSILIVIITMKVSIGNKILEFFGSHVFSIYILQRIPMIAFGYLGLDKVNYYAYFIVCFIITIVISFLFDLLMKKIDKLILKI